MNTATQTALLKLFKQESFESLNAHAAEVSETGNAPLSHILERAAELILQVGEQEANIRDRVRNLEGGCRAITENLLAGKGLYAPSSIMSYAEQINRSIVAIQNMTEELRRLAYWVKF